MKIHDARPKSFAALWAIRFSAFAFFLCFFIFGLHFLSIVSNKDFLALLLAVVILSGIGFCLSFIAFFSLWRVGAYGGRKAFLAFILSLFILLPYSYYFFISSHYPPYYDVSTNIEFPPFLPDLNRPADSLPLDHMTLLPYDLQKAFWPEFANRRYPSTAEQIEPFVKNAIEKIGWKIVKKEENSVEKEILPKKNKKKEKRKVILKKNEILIQAVAKNFPLFLERDVLIRLKNEKESCLIDVRSSSRYLKKDSFKNVELIQNFIDLLDQEIFLKQNMGQLYIEK